MKKPKENRQHPGATFDSYGDLYIRWDVVLWMLDKFEKTTIKDFKRVSREAAVRLINEGEDIDLWKDKKITNYAAKNMKIYSDRLKCRFTNFVNKVKEEEWDGGER